MNVLLGDIGDIGDIEDIELSLFMIREIGLEKPGAECHPGDDAVADREALLVALPVEQQLGDHRPVIDDAFLQFFIRRRVTILMPVPSTAIVGALAERAPRCEAESIPRTELIDAVEFTR